MGDRRRFSMMGLLRKFSGHQGQGQGQALRDQLPLMTEGVEGGNLTVVTLAESEFPSEFITECVSLQDLEMTMELEFAAAVHQNVWNILRKPQRRASTVVVHDLDSDSDEHDPDMDPVAWLSDSELDINFDPKNEELAHDYKYGGYHPVLKGEVYYSDKIVGRQYIIMRKLGWGHFSTVWLAKVVDDGPLTVEEYVALKFVKLNKNYIEAAEDEIRLLRTLQDPKAHGAHLKPCHLQYFDQYYSQSGMPDCHPGFHHMMKLLDDFKVTGPHGQHICMVFELLGENILHTIYKCKQLNCQLPLAPVVNQLASLLPSQQFKFSKWGDPLKKLTKLMLSLGLRLPKKLAGLLAQLSIATTNTLMSVAPAATNDLVSLLAALGHFKRTANGLPLAVVKVIVQQLLQAMDYMHHCGVIHTDLKPENILIEIKGVNDLIRELERVLVEECERKRLELRLVRNMRRPRTLLTSYLEVGSYRLSKNLVGTLGVCPVRCLKPLSRKLSVAGGDSTFREFPFSESPAGLAPLDSAPSSFEYPLEAILVKIADLGNGTFANNHFTNQIQTRQYRLPEILLRYKTWGALTDVWLLGCIIFELITGDYLFDPHDGKSYEKDEDHLAQIIELVGKFPSDQYLVDCKYTSKYFKIDANTDSTVLKNIDDLKYWGLEDVFVEKYKFDRDDEVALMSDFISKCLTFEVGERYDCALLQKHPWLTGEGGDDILNDWHDVPGFTGVY